MSDQPEGQGWWLASDGKWYAPELHPGLSHDALTQELPTVGSPPPVPPPPPVAPPVPPPPVAPTGSTVEPAYSQHPPTLTNPLVVDQPLGGDDGSNKGSKRNLILVLAAILLAFIVGVGVALLVANRSGGDSASTERAIPTTTAEMPASSTTSSSPERETSTTVEEQSTTSTTTSIPLVPPPPSTEAERSRMPDVVCMDLQTAQDTIQEAGVFFSRSFDASGAGRLQIIDRNWIVVSQDPEPGALIGEAEANLGVVKKGEPAPC